MVPYGRQDVHDDDIDAVVSVLRSDFLTQGPAVPRFEAALAAACQARHAVAVNSATSALHVACLALGVGPGDWLWTSPNSFVASANCGRYCGAQIDFVDIDPRSYNLSPAALAVKLEESVRRRRLPKVIVPVHFAGQPCEMEAIHDLARRHGVRIIEDAAHAIGARYHDEPVGSCRFSDITVFSFHPVKIITSGEGGAAVTNDPSLAARMARLRSHGITRDRGQMERPDEGAWYYEQIDEGFNYRMTDIQAALGHSQLQRLQAYIARRHALAERYDRLLDGSPIVTPWRPGSSRSAMHLYIVRIAAPLDRRRVFDALRAAGIGVNVHYIPIHTQPPYRRLGFKRGDFPVAEQYYEEAISLPMYPTLSDAQQDHVVTVLRQATHAQ
jgi:UDP-4-amino-4,6-dideoxy-N-acetyl-beta-L-altrosamine transaminase